MDDHIQTVVTVIISVFLLFIFPVYMAYEKKDDISYALAMRYTQDLVDNVRSRGYLTQEMYDSYIVKLGLTGNTYDVQLTHEYNRYDPITNYYKLEDEKYVIVKTTTQEARKQYENDVLQEGINKGEISSNYTNLEEKEYLQEVYNNLGINKVEDTYLLSKQVYNKDYILNILKSEKKFAFNTPNGNINCEDNDLCLNAYIMNEDDNFNVTIKNTNTTLATVMYNMVTANTLDNNTRIYVNYGGPILADKWYGQIDYSVMDHDNITVSQYTDRIIFTDEKSYLGDSTNPITRVTAYAAYKEYSIEFDIKPEEITELRAKGITGVKASNYNLAFGNETRIKDALNISVGINGISLILQTGTQETENKVVLSYPVTINEYINVKIDFIKKNNEKFAAVLYLNDEKVAESIEFDESKQITTVGKAKMDNVGYFKGKIKNLKIRYKTN